MCLLTRITSVRLPALTLTRMQDWRCCPPAMHAGVGIWPYCPPYPTHTRDFQLRPRTNHQIVPSHPSHSGYTPPPQHTHTRAQTGVSQNETTASDSHNPLTQT
jgi:hypothetical protein